MPGQLSDAVPATEPGETVRELRREYHDRIAGLRSMSVAIVAEAAERAEAAVAKLGQVDQTVDAPAHEAGQLAGIADVEAEVLALLALQAPVARDLRVILSSRDIAHLGELCLGLIRVLSTSACRARDALSADVGDRLCQIAQRAAALLRLANGAWITLDEAQATDVIQQAGTGRQLLRAFFADLASVSYGPVDAAVELGMSIRACERLADHAVEIADRVLFAINGTTSHSALDALSS